MNFVTFLVYNVKNGGIIHTKRHFLCLMTWIYIFILYQFVSFINPFQSICFNNLSILLFFNFLMPSYLYTETDSIFTILLFYFFLLFIIIYVCIAHIHTEKHIKLIIIFSTNRIYSIHNMREQTSNNNKFVTWNWFSNLVSNYYIKIISNEPWILLYLGKLSFFLLLSFEIICYYALITLLISYSSVIVIMMTLIIIIKIVLLIWIVYQYSEMLSKPFITHWISVWYNETCDFCMKLEWNQAGWTYKITGQWFYSRLNNKHV